MQIHEPTEEEKKAALDSFFATVRSGQKLASEAEKSLKAHSETLINAIRTGSGQSEKVSRIIRSVWNGEHKTGLCDDLCGLDYPIGEAVIALISARVRMGGESDHLIRHILCKSGEMELLIEMCATA